MLFANHCVFIYILPSVLTFLNLFLRDKVVKGPVSVAQSDTFVIRLLYKKLHIKLLTSL